MFSLLTKKQKFKSFFTRDILSYEPPPPGEIKALIKDLSKCPHCHFLIFDNYWSAEIKKNTPQICPTCGNKINKINN